MVWKHVMYTFLIMFQDQYNYTCTKLFFMFKYTQHTLWLCYDYVHQQKQMEILIGFSSFKHSYGQRFEKFYNFFFMSVVVIVIKQWTKIQAIC